MIHSFGNSSPASLHPSSRSDMEQSNPLIQQHNPGSADMAYAAKLADELTNISGANVIVYPRTNNSDIDEVWEEDSDPTYGAGKNFKAFFAPQPLETALTPWGAEAPNQTDVVFSRGQVAAEMGERMIRIGDIIALPYNGTALHPDKYRVLNAFDSGNFRYDWLYYSCKVENITDDITIDIDHK